MTGWWIFCGITIYLLIGITFGIALLEIAPGGTSNNLRWPTSVEDFWIYFSTVFGWPFWLGIIMFYRLLRKIIDK